MLFLLAFMSVLAALYSYPSLRVRKVAEILWQGLSGPASNVLASMNLRLPDPPSDDDGEDDD
jgi:hypothetical protein